MYTGVGIEEDEDLNKTCQLDSNYSPQTAEAMSKLSEKDVSYIYIYIFRKLTYSFLSLT